MLFSFCDVRVFTVVYVRHVLTANFLVPNFIISGLFCQMVSFIAGKLMERFLPAWRVSIRGYSMSLNPGPFNIKEHALITVMANIVCTGAPVVNISATQQVYYNAPWSIGKQILLGLSFQLMGFAYAGMMRQVLIWPSSMIWPGVLVRTALLNTMHRNFGPEKKHVSRVTFLWLACLCSFIYYWLPGYLFTALSIFNWVCWIAPDNVMVNSIFGSASGLGLGLLTLDWSMISFSVNPLVIPVCQFYSAFSEDAHSSIVVGAMQYYDFLRVLDLDCLADPLG